MRADASCGSARLPPLQSQGASRRVGGTSASAPAVSSTGPMWVDVAVSIRVFFGVSV